MATLSDDRVRMEVHYAREAMCSTKTTREQWDRIGIGLGHLRYNNKMSGRAKLWLDGAIVEYARRKIHMEARWATGDKR